MSLTQEYHDRFGGLGRLLGAASLEILFRARVAIVGIGGVGSWTAEAIARSGVGNLLLVDGDDLCITNTNRQIHALEETVGFPKTEILAERLRKIHPQIHIEQRNEFLKTNTLNLVFDWKPDVVIDAVDSVRVKKDLYINCRARNVGLVMAGAAGGKADPTAIRCTDLADTTHDMLFRRVRKVLRKEGEAPPDGEPFGARAVYVESHPVFPMPDGSVCGKAQEGSSLRLDCASGLGTACFLTGPMGMALAAEAIKLLLNSSKLAIPESINSEAGIS